MQTGKRGIKLLQIEGEIQLFLSKKNPLVKLKLTEEVYGICQNYIFRVWCTLYTGPSFCLLVIGLSLFFFLPLASAQFSLMKSFEREKLGILHAFMPCTVHLSSVSSCSPVLKFLHQSNGLGRWPDSEKEICFVLTLFFIKEIKQSDWETR